jgi:hypothetical protein
VAYLKVYLKDFAEIQPNSHHIRFQQKISIGNSGKKKHFKACVLLALKSKSEAHVLGGLIHFHL